MNPPLSFTNAKTQLNLLTSQTANFTFTDDEITQALTTAWNDPFVGNVVWDSSLSYVIGTWQYAIPSTLTQVREIYIQKTTDQYPQRIDPSLYEIVNGNIQFVEHVQKWIYDTYTLYLKGLYKLTTTDNLVTDNQVNYVLTNAAYILLRQLALKRTFVFLRNDTTMRDIVEARNDMRSDVLRYKQALLREFESS